LKHFEKGKGSKACLVQQPVERLAMLPSLPESAWVCSLQPLLLPQMWLLAQMLALLLQAQKLLLMVQAHLLHCMHRASWCSVSPAEVHQPGAGPGLSPLLEGTRSRQCKLPCSATSGSLSVVC